MNGAALVPSKAVLLERIAVQIAWHEAQALAAFVSAHDHKAKQGRLLIEAKEEAGHGHWMAWVEHDLARVLGKPWSQTYVNYLMQFSRLWEQHRDRIASLTGNLPLDIVKAIGVIQNLLGLPRTGGAREPAPRDVEFFPFNLPRSDYRIILADPPWQYDSWSGKSKDPSKRRVVEDEYATMPLEAIKALPVVSIAAPDAVLLCWATMPLLREALEVVEAWGFEYRTAFLVWGKLNADRSPAVGFGRYTRSNAEVCLLGRRGSGVPPVDGVAVPNLLLSQRAGHSQKPHGQYEVIDQVFGREVARVELFARGRMPGWDVWGFEAPEDITPVMTRLAEVG